MTHLEKIHELQATIRAAVAPLVDRDYWLLEVPYYTNIGDTLIWQGEMDFSKTLPYRCKGMKSYSSRELPKVKDGDLVLFQGGGNFGDLWKEPRGYRRQIMEAFPHCKYVVFPQTVQWNDGGTLKADAEFYAKYDCTICARDQRSYDILKANFKNEILLVPDMAFCIDMAKWHTQFAAEKPLLIKRCDCELKMMAAVEQASKIPGIDIEDWRTMSQVSRYDIWGGRIRRHLACGYDWYMDKLYRPYLINSGIQQLASHTEIYTTRLHACILSILLGKDKIAFFDNSYGKNSGFYETWLSDCDNVEMVYG